MCCTEQASTTVWHVSRHKWYCITSIADLSFVPHLVVFPQIVVAPQIVVVSQLVVVPHLGRHLFFSKALTSIADLFPLFHKLWLFPVPSMHLGRHLFL